MFVKHWGIVVLGFCSALILANAPYALSQSVLTSSPAPTSNSSSVMVQLDDRPLFVLRTKGVSTSIEERALEQERRLEQFAKSTVPVESLSSSDIDGATLVGAEDVLLFAVTDKDAQAVGKTRQVLVQEYIQKLQQAVERYREERGVQSRVRASIIAFLSTFGLVLVLVFLNLIHILQNRLRDCKRANLIKDVREAQEEFAQDKC